MLEHKVCSNIMAHLDEHKLLSAGQHAQLITVINDWAKILDKGGQVDTCILDFKKAFDTSRMNYLNIRCMVMVLEERL